MNEMPMENQTTPVKGTRSKKVLCGVAIAVSAAFLLNLAIAVAVEIPYILRIGTSQVGAWTESIPAFFAAFAAVPIMLASVSGLRGGNERRQGGNEYADGHHRHASSARFFCVQHTLYDFRSAAENFPLPSVRYV